MNRIRIAALAAVAAATIAGCSTTPHAKGFGPAYRNLAGLAAQISHASAKLMSVQGTLHLKAGPLTETGTYTQTLHAGKVGAFDSQYTVNLQGQTTKVRVIIVDGTIYVDRGQNDKPWLIATPDSSDPVAAQLAQTMPTILNESSVQYYVVLLRSARDLEVVGPESVDGVESVRYHVSIDTRAAAKNLPGDQAQQMQQAADAGVDSIPLDLWVDAQGRPVKIADKVETEQATAQLDVRLGHFNKPVDISAPPEDQIDQE